MTTFKRPSEPPSGSDSSKRPKVSSTMRASAPPAPLVQVKQEIEDLRLHDKQSHSGSTAPGTGRTNASGLPAASKQPNTAKEGRQMGSARKEGKSAQPTPASIPTLTTHERYSDPRANLHIVSSDGTLFKVHMYNFATHCDLIASLISLADVGANPAAAASTAISTSGYSGFGSNPNPTAFPSTSSPAAAAPGAPDVETARLEVPASTASVLTFLDHLSSLPYQPAVDMLVVDGFTALELFEMADLLRCDKISRDARECLYVSASAVVLFKQGLKRDLDADFIRAGFEAVKEGRLGEKWDDDGEEGLASLPGVLLAQVIGRIKGGQNGSNRQEKAKSGWPSEQEAFRGLMNALKGDKNKRDRTMTAYQD